MIDRSRAQAELHEAPLVTSNEAAVIGDPRLHQIRDFLDDQEVPPASPLLIATRTFRGRRHLVTCLAVLLAVLFGVGAFFAVSPKYQSQGLIRVAARVPKIMYADPNDPRLRLFDSFVSAEVTYLQSRPVLERALDALVADGSISSEGVMDISELGRMITVRKDKGLITVTATSTSPQQASNTVNALLKSYTSLHAEASNQAQTIRERQLVDREQELLAKLRVINSRILEVGEEHGTTSIAKAHLNKVTQLEDIDQRISELETTIAQQEAEESSTEFDTGDDEIKRVTVLDKAMADMTFDRAKRAAALESLKLRYRRDHLNVRKLESEIAVIDGAIEARRQQIVTLGKTGALTSGGGQEQGDESLAGLRALREKLQVRRAEVGDEAKRLNSKLIELTFLKEEHGEVRSLLDETRRALEEVRVESRNSLPGSVEVIAFGAKPKQPVENKRKKLAIAGTGFGVLVALGLVVLGGLFRPRLRYSDELVSTIGDASVLGVVPQSDPNRGCNRIAVHRMRNRLQLADTMDERNGYGFVLTVCAPRTDSGVSTLAQALAESFTVAGMQTLLVDADLGEAALSRRLELTEAPGLREAIIRGELPHRHAFKRAGLQVLPVGTNVDISDEHLSLPQIRNIITGLRNRHQVIVIDAGSVDANLSTNLTAALADQVVVVIRAGDQVSEVHRVAKRLERDVIRPPLFAFNAARADDPGLISNDSIRDQAVPVAAPS